MKLAVESQLEIQRLHFKGGRMGRSDMVSLWFV